MRCHIARGWDDRPLDDVRWYPKRAHALSPAAEVVNAAEAMDSIGTLRWEGIQPLIAPHEYAVERQLDDAPEPMSTVGRDVRHQHGDRRGR